MPQAIVTNYLPATNHKPSRIKAKCERGSITISSDCELSGDNLHRSVVKALCAKFAKEDVAQYGEESRRGNPWLREFVTGGLPDGSTVHVFVN
jgi:hypothetical protein